MKSYYVYIYFDSGKDDEPFYVGKGQGRRCYSHMQSWRLDESKPYNTNPPLIRRLKRILSKNYEPTVVTFDCSTEVAAYELERGLIDLIGRKDRKKGPLLNLIDGIADPEATVRGIDYDYCREVWENWCKTSA